MLQKNKDGISWLEFELLSEANLKHGVFLSPLNFKGIDWPKTVLNIPTLVSGKHCHGKDVSMVHSGVDRPTCDAIVTKRKI